MSRTIYENCFNNNNEYPFGKSIEEIETIFNQINNPGTDFEELTKITLLEMKIRELYSNKLEKCDVNDRTYIRQFYEIILELLSKFYKNYEHKTGKPNSIYNRVYGIIYTKYKDITTVSRIKLREELERVAKSSNNAFDTTRKYENLHIPNENKIQLFSTNNPFSRRNSAKSKRLSPKPDNYNSSSVRSRTPSPPPPPPSSPPPLPPVYARNVVTPPKSQSTRGSRSFFQDGLANSRRIENLKPLNITSKIGLNKSRISQYGKGMRKTKRQKKQKTKSNRKSVFSLRRPQGFT
jgi:hypothetical protein